MGQSREHIIQRIKDTSSCPLCSSTIDQVDDVDLAKRQINGEDEANDEEEGRDERGGVGQRNVKESNLAPENTTY